jgi:hypothetical protein
MAKAAELETLFLRCCAPSFYPDRPGLVASHLSDVKPLVMGTRVVAQRGPGRYHHPSRAARLGTPVRSSVLMWLSDSAAVVTNCTSTNWRV